MTVKKNVLLSSSRFVHSMFDRKSTIAALYHNFDHTLEVVEHVKEICAAMNLSQKEREIVLIAAWFHDTGYLFSPIEHEERSAAIAIHYLKIHEYPESKIKKVVRCIRATKVPQRPKTQLEQIMCDADLLLLGKKDSIPRGEMLRVEIESYSGIPIPENEWIKQSISFFRDHRYFTPYAFKKYSSSRNKNLAILQKRLKKLEKNKAPRRSGVKKRI